MKPGGGGSPSGELLELINRDFGSFERFVEDIKLAAATQFGSGWAWLACGCLPSYLAFLIIYLRRTIIFPLVLFSPDKANRLDVENAVNPNPSYEDKKLVVVKSPNAVNPLIWDYSVSIMTD